MREILFRGKTSDGEWVYGYIGTAFTMDENRKVKLRHFTALDCLGCSSQVIVLDETIGQYTGLTDKNGVRIFEGDIVHCVSKLDSADMVVIFECGQFRMVLAEKYHEYQTNAGYYDINCFEKEVIGNIHDNPELLEAAAKPAAKNIAQRGLAPATENFELMEG